MTKTLTDILGETLAEMMTDARMVRPYVGSDRLTVDDSKVYGRTDSAMRALMQGVVFSVGNEYEGDPRLTRAVERAREWGRVSYAYAGGWYDAVKRGKSSEWCTAVLAGMYEFSLEAEFAEFVFAAEFTGMRTGYAHAWETYLTVHGLSD